MQFKIKLRDGSYIRHVHVSGRSIEKCREKTCVRCRKKDSMTVKSVTKEELYLRTVKTGKRNEKKVKQCNASKKNKNMKRYIERC